MHELNEKCAVFGIFGEGLDVARLTYYGLYALQHRGQESSGIATSDGARLTRHVDMGLVSQVFTEKIIASLKGHIAIGHNRYSTTGGSHVENAHPFVIDDLGIALAHNGNLPSTTALETFLNERGSVVPGAGDSRLMLEAIAVYMREGKSLEDAIEAAYPLFTGAFSLTVLSKDKLIALRDGYGMRPLALAKINGGYCVASETVGFHPVGAEFLRDVKPGEMIIISKSGMETRQLTAAPVPKFDIFEFVYFARYDSELEGQSVYEVRKRFGEQLAHEYKDKLALDMIVPVPETAVPVALGYARVSGVPLEFALGKNRYIHRTFIQPEQHIRDQGVKAKLTPITQSLKGKRVGIVDDSIVRGTTSKKIVRMLFEAGAKEVHFLVSSPPVKYPDFYGIDTPKQDDLIASHMSVEEIRAFLGATTLSYLSLDGMLAAVGIPKEHLSTSCFTGEYPIDLQERAQEVKKV